MQISKAVDAGKLAEARLPELLQIHDLGKDLQPERYGVKGLPSGLRRRTRSHNSYRHAKRPRAATQVSGFNEPKMMNRKMRRSKQFREYQGNPFEACASASTSTDSIEWGTWSRKRLREGKGGCENSLALRLRAARRVLRRQ